ncbi:MAG: hypothetical protein WA364_06650 [Candidatus Nitrosopolaris sp.]
MSDQPDGKVDGADLMRGSARNVMTGKRELKRNPAHSMTSLGPDNLKSGRPDADLIFLRRHSTEAPNKPILGQVIIMLS